jgi:hypothetical protein
MDLARPSLYGQAGFGHGRQGFARRGAEVGQLLTSLPFWGSITWEVIPLQSVRSTIDRECGVVAALRGRRSHRDTTWYGPGEVLPSGGLPIDTGG